MRNRKLLLIILMFIVVGLLAFSIIRKLQLSSTLNIEVAPNTAKVTIDGHAAKVGINHVEPGTYGVYATMSGFGNSLQTVSVKKGQTKVVSIVLTPTSANTQNYYATHPSAQQEIEKISGQNFDSTTQNLVQTTPLIKMLPFLGPGLEFRIDYGNTASGQAIIYITAPNAGAQQDAVTWIKNQGFDPSTLDIQYITGQP